MRRSATRRLWLLAPALVASLALPGLARAANLVEALNEPGGGLYSEERHYWSPERVSLSGAGTVTFTNKSASVPHGIYWTSATKPSCEEGAGKVPVGFAKSATSWSGACSFLKPGAYTYYCTVHGPAMSGTIDVLGTPEASTEAASAVSQTGATLHGSVKPEGNAVEYRFEYGTASVAEHSTSTLALGAEDFTAHPVSAAVGGLAPNTTYHFRLTILYGEAHTVLHAPGEQELTTLSPLPPVVKAGPVSAPGETQATLTGTVDPEGEATEYFFEYGLSEAEYVATAVVMLPADSATHTVSAPASSLRPASEYGYRLVAKNGSGKTEATGAFKTASPPPPPEEKPPAPPPSPGPTPSPTPGPTSPEPTVPPLAPPASEPGLSFGPALTPGSLKASGHGASVRGSIGVGLAGAGGRLELDLLAKPAALRSHGSKPVAVGRFVRASVSSGRLSFSIALTARAKAALRRRGRLTVTVRATLTTVDGEPVRLTRALALRG
jgi:plastocyanin